MGFCGGSVPKYLQNGRSKLPIGLRPRRRCDYYHEFFNFKFKFFFFYFFPLIINCKEGETSSSRSTPIRKEGWLPTTMLRLVKQMIAGHDNKPVVPSMG